MKISIVIPVLDEERRIGERLAGLRGFEEVIVVDGGSRDRTVAIARGHPGVRVESAFRGRALQMNHGARLAGGDVLLFLHADVALPLHAAAHVERALADERVVAGAFRTWHVADGRNVPWLHLADLRSRYSRLPYGDQALFVRGRVFARMGGFAPWPLMEDVDFVRRLRREGPVHAARLAVVTSARRWERDGWVARSARNVTLFALYRMGVSPHALARWYSLRQ